MSRWDYVALGHYHVYREIAPNVLLQRLDRLHEREHVGRAVRSSAWPASRARDSSSATSRPARTRSILCRRRARSSICRRSALGIVIAGVERSRFERSWSGVAGGIDDKIVRLMIRDVPRHIARELDHKTIRDYKRRALNFHLDLVGPRRRRSQASGAPGRRPSLNEIVREKLAARPLDADIDRGALIERAMAYLDEAQAVAPTAADRSSRECG